MGMQALYTGLSGLIQSSNALNTTANNLANVNTNGYVRQQVVYQDTIYTTTKQFATNTLQTGLGVKIQEVSHVRDLLVDKAYRKENGRENFYQHLWNAAEEIQTQLGELHDVSYQESISSLLGALNEVAKTPDDNVARSALVQSAVAFVDRSKSIYNGLVSYQNNINDEVLTVVNRINQIGDGIMALNRKISSIESGIENANTLRDERDVLIDELSKYMKIDYSEDEYGVVSVMAEGVLFCNNNSVTKLGVEMIDGSGFYNPIWPDLNRMTVYNMGGTISTEKNTDIGGLKGLLAARGGITPTYSNTLDVPPATLPDASAYDLTTPAGQAAYDADLYSYQEYRDYLEYEESSEYSILVRTMANFDKLVNSIAEAVNDVLCPNKTVTIGGQDYKVLDTEKAGRGMDVNKSVGEELFSRIYTERYVQQTLPDGNTYYVFNDTNTFGNISKYSVLNLEVNPDVLQDFTTLPLTTLDGQVDYDKAKNLVSIFSDDVVNYNGGLEKLTFEEFYEEMVSDIGNTGKIYESMTDNQSGLTASLDNERQEVMSVSSDEELSNMIKYQQAYNASSRYINVITAMMDSVINNMGHL